LGAHRPLELLHRELRVLLVHGLLHLRGYDHIEPGDAVVMRAKEADLLRVLREDPVGLVERAEVGAAG
jgi:rRNA maturation RNase YbeY